MRIFRMMMECLTPLHCGSGQEDKLQDQPVARDAYDLWRIPGSSIAGVLRHLADRIDEGMARELFGEQKGTESRASLIWCPDALLVDFDGRTALMKVLEGKDVSMRLGPYVRDHVNIDLQTGTAKDGGKFDAEIVPAGTRFLLEIVLDGWNIKESVEQTAFFDKLCAHVAEGLLPLGGKNGMGYGRYRALEWQYREIDLHSLRGMQIYLNLTRHAMLNKDEGTDIPLPSAEVAGSARGLNGMLEIPFRSDGPLLIGGGSVMDSNADIVFARTPVADYDTNDVRMVFALPGSSIKGALRHRAYHILEALGAKPEPIMDALFGHVKDDGGQCGKISVEDCVLHLQKGEKNVQHVAIDRFTGGALAGALFNEAPIWQTGLSVPIRLHLTGVEAHEAALVFHALLDLAEGGLPLGSGGNRGNGVLTLPDWPQNKEKALATIKGTLAWEGTPMMPMTVEGMRSLAADWDTALQEQVCA